VRRVHIVGAAVPDGLLAEVFTNEGAGTLVVADAAAAAAPQSLEAAARQPAKTAAPPPGSEP
jgi:hypothetical protein